MLLPVSNLLLNTAIHSSRCRRHLKEEEPRTQMQKEEIEKDRCALCGADIPKDETRCVVCGARGINALRKSRLKSNKCSECDGVLDG